jgi:hypothetical protein
MSAAAAVALLTAIINNLPAAIATGAQVIQLVNDGYNQLKDAIGDRDVTPAEIDALVAKIVANSAEIQAIG